MKAESSFNPTVISKAGAVGLMQMIPEAAIRHGARNLYDANENITGGAKHLRFAVARTIEVQGFLADANEVHEVPRVLCVQDAL